MCREGEKERGVLDRERKAKQGHKYVKKKNRVWSSNVQSVRQWPEHVFLTVNNSLILPGHLTGASCLCVCVCLPVYICAFCRLSCKWLTEKCVCVGRGQGASHGCQREWLILRPCYQSQQPWGPLISSCLTRKHYQQLNAQKIVLSSIISPHPPTNTHTHTM